MSTTLSKRGRLGQLLHYSELVLDLNYLGSVAIERFYKVKDEKLGLDEKYALEGHLGEMTKITDICYDIYKWAQETARSLDRAQWDNDAPAVDPDDGELDDAELRLYKASEMLKNILAPLAEEYMDEQIEAVSNIATKVLWRY